MLKTDVALAIPKHTGPNSDHCSPKMSNPRYLGLDKEAVERVGFSRPVWLDGLSLSRCCLVCIVLTRTASVLSLLLYQSLPDDFKLNSPHLRDQKKLFRLDVEPVSLLHDAFLECVIYLFFFVCAKSVPVI